MRWEYIDRWVMAYADDNIKLLDSMGEDGWELCGILNNRLFIFKRMKK